MTQANKNKIHNLEENIRFIERQFNYTFKNKSLIKQAFYKGIQHTNHEGKPTVSITKVWNTLATVFCMLLSL